MALTTKQRQELLKFKNKKILILGLKREGLSTFRLLRKVFPAKKLYLADQIEWEEMSPADQKLLNDDQHRQLFLGQNYLDYLEQFDIIFKTPGIPPTLPEIAKAKQAGVKIESQTRLFFALCPAMIIGVTGTKGKSTTTSLIHHVLSQNGLPTRILGNIGLPPLDQIEDIKKDEVIVMELSCHQLSDLTVSPQIAVIQNITSEHLDYYSNLKTYCAAKAAITKWQKPSDLVIYDPDFLRPRKMAEGSQAQKLPFVTREVKKTSRRDNSVISPVLWFEQKAQKAIYIGQNLISWKKRQYRNQSQIDQAEKSSLNQLQLNPKSGNDVQEISLKKTPLKGQHNLANMSPAIIIGFQFGLNAKQIQKAIETFAPLPHRLQYVATRHGVDYYNDSMGTMPDASIAAIKAFAPRPIILLAGGSEKNSNYHQLARVILKEHVKEILLFPPTGDRIKLAIEEEAAKMEKRGLELFDRPKMTKVTSMPKAVRGAARVARSGDVVLLSPASASFGLFHDYADRGNQFIAAVKNLI